MKKMLVNVLGHSLRNLKKKVTCIKSDVILTLISV